MAIVPTGKTRVMVAQDFSSPLSEGYHGESISENREDLNDIEGYETGGAMEEDLSENKDYHQEPLSPTEKPIAEEDGKKTLTSYIYEKLQSYGYPGRRLQEFKAEFVKESISPDGVKDIQVVIPDKKYPDEQGVTGTIENEELKDISGEVNKIFGLNFNGAERSDGKWTIKFTSADTSIPEEEINHDNLDQVYGKPDKGKSNQKPTRSASTIGEMIKEQKEKIVGKLKKMIGDKE
jgi:hypothetical protein